MALLSPLSGYNVTAHIAEETYDAGRDVPRTMIWSSRSSGFLGFIDPISLALCTTDIDSLTGNALREPIGVLIGQVLGVAGGVGLLSVNFVCQVAWGCVCESSPIAQIRTPYSKRSPFL